MTAAPTLIHTTDPAALAGKGRLVSTDPRDRRHMMRPREAAKTRTYRYWKPGAVLDQGNTPKCVAYSWLALLLAGPVRNKKLPDVNWLYDECQANDEWPGSSYDGTSVRAGAKVLQREGYLSEYIWAYDSDTVARWVLEHGPVVLGTDWLSGMDQADADGFIHAEGMNMGGHAYLATGVNLAKVCPDGSRGALRIVNSWGTEYGQGGMVWLSLADAGRLIAQWGEAAAPKELLRK